MHLFDLHHANLNNKKIKWVPCYTPFFYKIIKLEQCKPVHLRLSEILLQNWMCQTSPRSQPLIQVKVVMYEGMYDVVAKNPELCEGFLDLLNTHVVKLFGVWSADNDPFDLETFFSKVMKIRTHAL